jgi:Flp pilus assembly protein TadG
MMNWMKRFRRLTHDQQGVAYLEFAISLPFLMALFLGSVEVTRYIIIAQKVEKSSVTISDVVAQSETITDTQLDQLIAAVGEVMQPYSFGDNGYVIITSVTRAQGAANPVVNWQYHSGGWTHPSLVGSPSTVASLPNGLTLNERDTVIIAEVYYDFQPLLVNSVITGQQLYKVAIFKPRLGDLQTLG